MRRKVAARTINFGDVLEEVNQLSDEEQEMLTDIIRNRLRERRREEIAKNACETYKAIKEGHARTGSLDELKQDLMT